MKARLQNRQGPPLLQGYYDLAKLLRKEPVRSETASWIYVAGPRVYFAAAVAATTLVPVLVAAAPLESAGGILLLVGTLALGRFALATAALDTGSPFGGMGASRDMTIAALAEPALMLASSPCALAAGSLNLGGSSGGLAAAARRSIRAIFSLRRALHHRHRRDRPHSSRQPGHAPRADDDPRSDGARVRRPRPRAGRMGLGASRSCCT